MIVSNELNVAFFRKTAELIRDVRSELNQQLKAPITFVNLGGGFGIPYREDDDVLGAHGVACTIQEVLDDPNLEILTENGRWVTGPHGYLLTKVRYVMEKYKNFVSVDASMQNLMRPGMYGAYHHITVLGKGDQGELKCDIVGSLCENNDKFAVDRSLPHLKPGDILAIHDAGAHGHAMGFNYNGKLRSAEVLLRKDRSSELIRRAETLDDYFRTIVW